MHAQEPPWLGPVDCAQLEAIRPDQVRRRSAVLADKGFMDAFTRQKKSSDAGRATDVRGSHLQAPRPVLHAPPDHSPSPPLQVLAGSGISI